MNLFIIIIFFLTLIINEFIVLLVNMVNVGKFIFVFIFI